MSDTSSASSSSSYDDSDSSGNESSDDESYDIDDAPQTWKQYVKQSEMQKKKEFALKQRSVLQQMESEKQQDSINTIHDPLGVTYVFCICVTMSVI
jgi:hypothetical protein